MTPSRDADLWWKNAVFYCLDVETFLDSDGDGVGDLQGLQRRIDHIAGIGVTCLWLMPLYPSPNRDDGYDITDFYAVDERLGSLGDFVDVIRAAKHRGMRVVIDLVVNHTSDRHPWFRDARSSRDSRRRDFYVWTDDPPPTRPDELVFPDAEDSVWAYDERTGQHYLHHFYSHQPDLNIANPEVRDEIARIAGFWLQLGVDGFRVDAVPYLIQPDVGPDGTDGALDPHRLLKDLRSTVGRRRGDAVMLGEVNLPHDRLVRYFGDEPGDELQLAFDFTVMQHCHLAFARGDATTLAEALRARPAIPSACQWANFLRNHDELTLDQLSDAEREEVFTAFGPEEDMQLFGRGLRRRLPAMFAGDAARVRMAYSLLFSLPGAPVLFYGEEIGMGENLEVPGRRSVRTPMQWTSEPSAGFSTARPSKLRRRPPSGRFAPLAVNVEAQRRDPDSQLNWTERIIRRRRELPELGWGQPVVIDRTPPSVLAHIVTGDTRTLCFVHQLAPEAVDVTVHLPDELRGCPMVDLVDGLADDRVGDDGDVQLILQPYAHHWFAIDHDRSRGRR